jgi:hypothetical protein
MIIDIQIHKAYMLSSFCLLIPFHSKPHLCSHAYLGIYVNTLFTILSYGSVLDEII